MMAFLVFGQAQDRVFSRTYQSNVLPAGAKDLEYWVTSRAGREDFYHRLDQRLELEFGVGGNVQAAFYFNAESKVQLNEAGTDFTTGTTFGVSNEWKWKLSDPVANAVGSALYGEITVEPKALEFEAKLILDKRMGNTLLAYNLVGEMELEWEVATDGDQSKVEREKEYALEHDLAMMHFLKPNLGIGLEIRNHNEFAEGDWLNSALFAGPALHWSGNGWFINFNCSPQWTNLKKSGNSERLDLDDHEKVETRLLVGLSF